MSNWRFHIILQRWDRYESRFLTKRGAGSDVVLLNRDRQGDYYSLIPSAAGEEKHRRIGVLINEDYIFCVRYYSFHATALDLALSDY